MRYTLKKALVASRTSSSGRVGTPILGYSLLDSETGEVSIYSKYDAYRFVKYHKATNCEAKTRTMVVDGESETIYYLKPNDGTKMNEYLLSVE
ncbi:hypothetical protein [Bacillus phage vB_BceM_Bc431v3]|uniref:Uncharacterized protein n=1 Tax=Bacillus phage vB_BceM_Bc431v3 TaxID=1195072 RepID=M4HNK7_9CAUD|nr:hypothetical protein K201_gp181 [Bacillus phage vB_BceM_Bc431v3]AFQ96489.1 hypothetical protein [Bacillus phage vB_BceM_Bc431v3]